MWRPLMLVFALTSAAAAQPAAHQSVLRKLPAFSVVVEEIPPACATIITLESLRTTVELRLRSFGLLIRNASSPRAPFLGVTLNCLATGTTLAYNIHVDMNAGAVLSHNHINQYVIVWHYGILGTASVRADPATNKALVEGGLTSIIDHYINDHLAANPRTVQRR